MPEGFTSRNMTLPQTQRRFGATLGQIYRRWRARLDSHLASHGLTESRGLALMNLARAGDGITQRQLANRLGVEGPSLVRTLDWLEQEGFVERREAAHDRRAKTLHLTAKALPRVPELQQAAAAVRAEILEGITEAELLICLQVLSRVARNLGAELPPEEGGADGRRPA